MSQVKEILIDADGTLFTHAFPLIGKDIGAVPVLKDLVKQGYNLILFTMRSDRTKKGDTGDHRIADESGMFLTEVVQWFEKHGIPLYGIQRNPTQDKWTSSPKAYGQLIIDDICLGIPLVKWVDTHGGWTAVSSYKTSALPFGLPYHDRPYVDWAGVRDLLEESGILDPEKYEKCYE